MNKKTLRGIFKSVTKNVVRGATNGLIYGIGSLISGAVLGKADDLVNQIFEKKEKVEENE